MKRLRNKDKMFIQEYVSLNFRRQRELLRGIFPRMTPVVNEMRTDLKKVFEDEEELQAAVGYAENLFVGKVLRRPPINHE